MSLSPGVAASPGNTSSQAEQQKRKVDDEVQPTESKRQRIVGGFIDEDDDDQEYEDIIDRLGGASPDEYVDLESQLDTHGSESQPITQTSARFPQPESGYPSQDSLHSSFMKDTFHSDSDNFLPARLSMPTEQPRLRGICIKTCSGKSHHIPVRKAREPIPYERLVAGRSTTAPGRATKSYYGIEIHKLMDEAANDAKKAASRRQVEPSSAVVQPSIEAADMSLKSRKSTSTMWTEKYRARKFTDLIGDERTHRSVLRWLKGWDPIVFPNLAKSRHNQKKNQLGAADEQRQHRKVLLLCGPPGLGKTTLAHVCARQAGYEVLEINASDERSKDVVKNRIRDSLGTENVKGANIDIGDSKRRKPGRPICVVIDEVDGVVSGSSGGGEGGFMKALIDLVLLDQKNAERHSSDQQAKGGRKKKKGDNFRFLRPLILVCNDVYHPSLRPLRASSVAEMVHVRQAPLENVVQRVKHIFTKEGIRCDNDGARRLCEASWGVPGRRQQRVGSKNSGTGEGDIRSVLVDAEWVAHKLRNEGSSSPAKLTKNWLEQKVLNNSGSSFFKGLGRGGVREIVDRVFTEGAGFPETPPGIDEGGLDGGYESKVSVGVGDTKKRNASNKLREMVDSSGEHDRCICECFSAYPIQAFQDDTVLSKPNAAYDWLQFHDAISTKVFSAQDWDLGGYLSQSVLAFHQLFASANGKNSVPTKEEEEEDDEEHPFSGLRADYAAFEAHKQNHAILTSFQSSFSPPLIRLFRSMECVATELVPSMVHILSPDVKPVVIRGSGEQGNVASVRKESERALVKMAVRAMIGMGLTFEKVRVESDGSYGGGWAYRMEP